MKTHAQLTRREFAGVAGAAAAASIFTIVPRNVLGGPGQTPPSEKVNMAAVGAGGQAGGDIAGLAQVGANFAAFCDVDDKKAADTYKKYPNVKKFKDFRKMLDTVDKEIDAVLVGTPDHFHAVATMGAIKRGKHVYCEKPLAHSIYEVREMMKAAKEHNVVTQLGNQGHSSDTIRLFCEWVWDGAIGKVHTVNLGCGSVNSAIDQLQDIKQRPPVPPTLDWDLWLGPAQWRPYHPAYLPGAWRKWVPFGDGTLGDWACHVIDPIFWAFDLGAPKTITAKVKNYDFKTQGDTFPKGEIVTYEFAANAKRGPVTVNWYSGTEKVPRPAELEADRKHKEIGAVVIGDKGVITYGSHGAGEVRIIPETKMKEYKRPDKTIPRAPNGNHHKDFLEAIKKKGKAGSDFSYGGPLTEVALLGLIAVKLAGRKLEWDGAAMQFTNSPEANAFLNPPYRKGWSL